MAKHPGKKAVEIDEDLKKLGKIIEHIKEINKDFEKLTITASELDALLEKEVKATEGEIE